MNRPRFKSGDRVVIKSKGITGHICVVDRQGGGVYWGVEPSYDIQTPNMIFKHVPDSDLKPCS